MTTPADPSRTPAAAIRSLQDQAQASFLRYGPGDAQTEPVEIVETFGAYELEYAAIRKGVGILHEPQRGILNLVGKDRQDFLHRMLTQDINALGGGQSKRAFQLNAKGRIMADLIVHHGDHNTWLEGDAVDLPALAELYDQRLFGEDVTIENWADRYTAIALHGPHAGRLLATVTKDDPAAMLAAPGTHHVLDLADNPVTASRCDDCGFPGVRLWAAADHAPHLYEQLASACGGLVPDVQGGSRRGIAGRGIGWLAYNTARIEAGTPLFHIDFGTDGLPHETALLDQAVSFTAGCYLGQEIVARMQSLGHPKRVLVGLKFPDDHLPIAGSQVFIPSDQAAAGGQVVGAITSSTLSPMLGHQAIAFAVVKWGQHHPGNTLSAPAEGAMTTGTVGPLRFI